MLKLMAILHLAGMCSVIAFNIYVKAKEHNQQQGRV